MSLEFETIKISHFVDDMKNGGTPRRSVSKYWENGTIPWLKTGEINNSPILNNSEYITEEGLKKSSAKVLPINSVIMALYGKGTAGRVGLLKFKATTNQACCAMICKDRIKSEYLYYYLLSIQPQIELLANGSVQQNLSKEILADYDINGPKNYQDLKNIVWILKNIDQKIENNKSINKNLEQCLFYLFNEKFMQYDFNEFSNSKKQIPSTWNLGKFNDIIDSLGSGDWGKEQLTGNYTNEVYCIRGADIPDVKQGNKGKMPIRFILPKNFENRKLNENEIVIEISGGSPTQSTGRTVFITKDFLCRFNKDIICTNFCKVIKPKINYEIFLYLYLNYLYNKDVMFAYENGTTGIKNFDIKSFINNFLIVIPSEEDIINFNNLIKDVFKIIIHNGLEIEKLQRLIDTLLPKLMSGEIDVSKINCD
ncbi:MAG: restriction endonuclease subunit S, partial [Clostridia bacterium]|nr:restriction endonuclease subunit S [Clostridia bacterium]